MHLLMAIAIPEKYQKRIAFTGKQLKKISATALLANMSTEKKHRIEVKTISNTYYVLIFLASISCFQ